MLTVADVMNRQATSIPSDSTIQTAVERTLDDDISSLFVVTDDNRVIGILTESALLPAIFDPQMRNDPISLHMERNFASLNPDQPLEEIVNLFVLHRVRHIPVVIDGKLIAVVSRRNVFKAIFGQQFASKTQTANSA